VVLGREAGVLEVLGADADDDFAGRRDAVGHGNLRERQLQLVADDRGREEVHRRRADEARDEDVDGAAEERARSLPARATGSS
jgi:hypothetical protein